MKVGDEIRVYWVSKNYLSFKNILNQIGVVTNIDGDMFYVKFANDSFEYDFYIDNRNNEFERYKIFNRKKNLKNLLKNI